ncbi:MAG: S8 family serine peptidase [Candidatus Krumholzibacteriia bacterium]
MPSDRPSFRPPTAGRQPLSHGVLVVLVVGSLAWGCDLPPATAAPGPQPQGVPSLDRDGNGVDDLLDGWQQGRVSWSDLRAAVRGEPEEPGDSALAMPSRTSGDPVPAQAGGSGSWERGHLRVLVLGAAGHRLAAAREAAAHAGVCELMGSAERFGGVTVLALDAGGLAALLDARPPGLVALDRDGRPAVAESRILTGAERVRKAPWLLGGDRTASVAILDSGCDTAHDDLGDFSGDNIDGPPPAVGHALDWFSAAQGWPLFEGYKVVGWHDVTDDFPEAQGPWDYHHHGTALAGVVAGAGRIAPELAGLARRGRLTIVKYYDFDGIWHQWAGDFLLACDWLLDHHEVQRVQVALAAVNWDVDLGISAAVDALAGAGILLVVAAGNDGVAPSLGYPAAVPAALTVGAVNDLEALAAYSTRVPESEGGVDLVAPGGGALPASGRIRTTDNEPNDSYSERVGTSLAAAHVAAGAFLVAEALAREGYPLTAGAPGSGLLGAVLEATAAPVHRSESADGEDLVPLPAADAAAAGQGRLQVLAALQALLRPLTTADARADSLGPAGTGRDVQAWRLIAAPGQQYRVQATVTAGLDVALEYHDVQDAHDPLAMRPPVRRDLAGPGGTETLTVAVNHGAVALVVVKRLSGDGVVEVRASRESAPATADARIQLDGVSTGWGCAGDLLGDGEMVLVVPALVDFDPNARALHAIRADGSSLPGWPRTVFLPAQLLGGFTAPLVWDLDDDGADEVVVASQFGNIYFLDAGGLRRTVSIAANRVLLPAVGVIGPLGQRFAAVIDERGVLRRYDGEGNSLGTVELQQGLPLAPAVGQLDADSAEELVVVFESGYVFALEHDGSIVPGWPRHVGIGAPLAPVLLDGDGDGRHEIVVPVRVAETGELRLRRYHGDGTAAAGDGAVVIPPGGGGWLRLALPAVAGGSLPQDRQVVLVGLADSRVAGELRRWTIAGVRVSVDGAATAAAWPGFGVRSTTTSSAPSLRWLVWTGPVMHDGRITIGGDPELPLSLGWVETISGTDDITGAMDARLAEHGGFAARQPLAVGGNAGSPARSIWAAILPQESRRCLRVTARDEVLHLENLPQLGTGEGLWHHPRRDARNSGADPLRIGPTAAPAPAVAPRLFLSPNPGAGPITVAWRGLPAGPADLAVHDLRGRRLRSLELATGGGDGSLAWDGRDAAGRPVAAGTYLLVLRHAGGSITGRALLTR